MPTMTIVRTDVYRTEANLRMVYIVCALIGLTGGNDTVPFPNPLPFAPISVSYEGTAGTPAASWQAADATNLYVTCAGATANVTVMYGVG